MARRLSISLKRQGSSGEWPNKTIQCRDLIPYFSMHTITFFILKSKSLKLWDDVIFIRALEIIPLRFGSFYHFTFRNSLLSMNFSWNHLISPRVSDPVSQLTSRNIVLLWAYWNTTTLTLRVKFRGNTRSNQSCHVFRIYPLCSWYSTWTWLEEDYESENTLVGIYVWDRLNLDVSSPLFCPLSPILYD